MKKLTMLGVIVCVGLLFTTAAVLADPAGPPGGLDVKIVNPLPLPVEGDVNATVSGDVNVVNEPTVHIGSTAGEPFQQNLNITLNEDESYGFDYFRIEDESRLEIEYIFVQRVAPVTFGILSEKVSVNLDTRSYSDVFVRVGFTESDFGWGTVASAGRKVLLHIQPGGDGIVRVDRSSVSNFETFRISVVGYLFPVQ